jgi:hypothetical protein
MSKTRATLLLVSLVFALVACTGGDEDDCMSPIEYYAPEEPGTDFAPAPMVTHTFGHDDEGGC